MVSERDAQVMISSTGALPLNTLLASLPDETWDRVQHHLNPVYLPLGKVLYDPGVQLDEIYFPTTAIISLQYELADGTCAEMAVVGNEGILGIAVFMGGNTTSWRAVVDTPGNAYRLKPLILRDEFSRGGAMRGTLLRYTQSLITQMAQTAACNRHHSVDQQMCRWLLGRLDRLDSSEFLVTHEVVADRLGVRRESVTDAAANLQQAGLIRYRRGHISVLDRAGLERRCCECYAVVKQETDRLLHISVRSNDITSPNPGVSRRSYPPRRVPWIRRQRLDIS
jgi:CRP-like cAMP-binding protein